MNDSVLEHVNTTIDHLQNPTIATRLDPERCVPGESFARYYGRRQGDEAREELSQAKAALRQKDEALQQQGAALQQRDAVIQQMVARLRQRGTPDNELAEDLGRNLAQFHRLSPPQG